MNDGFYRTMEATAKRLDAWKDNHLSVEAQNGLKPELRARKVGMSFPPAPREYRGLMLRRAGRGVRP